MDIGVDLYAAFLLPRLRMASDSREDKVGEQADCRRIDNLQPVYPTEDGLFRLSDESSLRYVLYRSR